MSDDFGAKGSFSAQSIPSKDDLINIAQTAINSTHNGVRRDTDGTPILDASVQQPGATVDLCHKQIINLPEEVVEIIKNEIERLAISHNGISTFPPSLAECRRLRYLNGRYNRLKEIPKAVLMLPALEILDLSRNRIRTLPDSIRNMTSLKVLALQRNQIERLPSCLGDMSTLRVLKINENPLLFPPKDICAPSEDPGGPSVPGDKAMIAVTQKIKKYLRDHAGATPKARSTFNESDSDVSESNAETPRPYRPMGTRFPVRPSLGGAEGMGMSSTSPDPPPIPSKSHERMRSNQTPTNRKQTLLSPPDSSIPGLNAFGEPGSDVTVRPKRHGMITPRGPDGASQQIALSPSALQEAFSNISSRPPSRTESALSNSSTTTESIIDTSKIAYHTAGDLYQRLCSLKPILDTNIDHEARAKIESELQIAMLRADALQKAINKSPTGVSQYLPHRHVLKPLVDCLTSVSTLSRLLVRATSVYCRSNSHEAYRMTFWNTQRDIWEIHVANFRMSGVLASVTHSRQTSTSSQYPVPTKSRFDSAQVYSRSGLAPSPTVSSFSASTMVNGGSSLSTLFSPVPAPLNVQSRSAVTFGSETAYPLREDELRQEISRDADWENMCRILHNMCEVTVDNLSKVQANYRAEKAKAARQLDPEHELVKQLSSLINRCNTIMEAANTLARRLEALTPQNRAIRHSLEFWALPRTILLDWFGLARQLKSLSPSAYSADIKNTMRPIQQSIKEVARIVENSPWASYMHKSKHNGFSEAQQPRQNQSNGANPASNFIKSTQSNSNSVPSTPLSAALGPAAAAALPSKGAMGRPAINFFERADRFASATTQRQPDVLYSKRGV